MDILILLGWLYFIQGIPYGIQDKFMPIQLRLQNLSFTSVSLMKGLLLPWICKGLWAPFIQIFLGPYFWLMLSVSGLVLVSAISSMASPENIINVSLLLFFFNLLSALQDIAVDGFALKLLSDKQLGFGNSLQIVLYKVGSLLGGTGLLYLSNYTDWSTCFVSLSLVYLSSFLVFFSYFRSFQSDNNAPTGHQYQQVLSNTVSKKSSGQSVDYSLATGKLSDVYAIFQEVFKTNNLIRFSFYVAVYKMGERGAINNFPLFLLDQGFSSNQLAFWNGLVSQSLSILGSTFGGVLLSTNCSKKSSTSKLLKDFTFHRSVSIFLCFFVTKFWDLGKVNATQTLFFHYFSIVSLLYLNFTSGVISTLTFTLMMEESRKLSKSLQSTHYNCLSSIEVTGKLLFATCAGFFIDKFDICPSFMLFFVLSAMPYFLI